MAVNPNISTQIQVPQQPSFAEKLSQMLSIKAQQQGIALNKEQLERAQSVTSALRESPDLDSAIEGIMKVDPQLGLTLRTGMYQSRTAELQNQVEQLKLGTQKRTNEAALYRSLADSDPDVVKPLIPQLAERYGLDPTAVTGDSSQWGRLADLYEDEAITQQRKTFELESDLRETQRLQAEAQRTFAEGQESRAAAMHPTEKKRAEVELDTAQDKRAEAEAVSFTKYLKDFAEENNTTVGQLDLDQKNKARREYAFFADSTPTEVSLALQAADGNAARALAMLQEQRERLVQQRQQTGAIAGLPDDMPDDWRNVTERALLGIQVPSRRTAPINLINRLWQNGNVDELRGVIKDTTFNGLNVGERDQVRGREVTLNAIDQLEVLLDEMRDAGINTNILTGSFEDVARKLGTTTDPKLVEFASRIMPILMAYRLSVTGVQFGFEESKQYEQLFPNYRNTYPVNKAEINGMRKGMSENQNFFWKEKLGDNGARLIGVLRDSEGLPTGPTANVGSSGAGSTDDEEAIRLIIEQSRGL